MPSYGGTMTPRRSTAGSETQSLPPQPPKSLPARSWAADGKNLKVNLVLTDTKESFVLWIENAVLHHKKAAPAADANATLTLTKPIFIKMMAGTAGIKDTLMSDDLKIDGSKIDLVRFFTLIDKAPGTFAVVTR